MHFGQVVTSQYIVERTTNPQLGVYATRMSAQVHMLPFEMLGFMLVTRARVVWYA
jgi:hypothetical protein